MSRRVSIDTRTIEAGDVFIPVGKGIHFCDDAKAKGATVLDVDLVDYAKARRQQYAGIVIGITGSFGKTTLKDSLTAVLTPYGVSATEKNYNNEIGVPLTIANASLDDSYWVIEMGIRKPGDMAFLTDIVQPDIAILSGFGYTHMEFYNDPLDLLKEKLSIISKNTSAFFYPSNVLQLNELKEFLKCQQVTVIESNVDQLKNTNRDMCLSVAKHLFLDEINAEKALEHVKTSPHRLNRILLSDGTVLIDDSYNSNPIAVQFAVETVLAEHSNKTILLVLGDMAELGQQSLELHQETLNWVSNQSQVHVVTYGHLFESSSLNFDLMESLFDYVLSKFPEFDVILIKGSRSNQLDQLCEMLKFNFSS